MIESKYLQFNEAFEQGKLPVYWVVSKTQLDPNQSGVTERPLELGVIKWFGRRRQYVFVPNAETVWNKTCLNDIAAFIAETNQDHKYAIDEAKARKKFEVIERQKL